MKQILFLKLGRGCADGVSVVPGSEGSVVERVGVHELPEPSPLGVEPLEALLEVGRLTDDLGAAGLPQMLERVATAVSHVVGFATVVVNVYRPAWDDFEVAAVVGAEAVREALLGERLSRVDFDRLLDERFRVRDAYLIKSGAFDWEAEGFTTFASAEDEAWEDDSSLWRPADALFVPMVSREGNLFGVISVNEPKSGLRPSDSQLDLLVTLVGRAAAAVEAAQTRMRAAAQLQTLERLMSVSAKLRPGLSVQASLQLVCDAIQHTLGFEKAAVCLARDGVFRMTSAAGWPPSETPTIDLSVVQFERLLDSRYETFGCFLLTYEEALELIGPGGMPVYVSQLNGNGPRAWHRDWLVVPLRNETGGTIGFVWADDPVDRLLPEPERLQALRLFADQVTTTLEAEAQLSEIASLNEARRALIESAPIGILELAPDRTVRRWNPAATAIFGWTAEEVVGRPNPIVPAAEWADHLARTEPVLRSGATIYSERERVRKDGTRIDVKMRVAAVCNSEGAVTGMVAMVEDVSARVEAARALRLSDELSRKILDNTNDLISLIDLDGYVVFNSRSFTRILGTAADSRNGDRWGSLIHPDDLAMARSMVDDALRGKPSQRRAIRVGHADGSWRILEGAPCVIRNDDGEPEFILSVLRDVTEQRASEAKAQQAQRVEAVGRLTGGIAHDFNNLLTAIRGYAEIANARLGEREPEATRAIAESIKAADRAAALTQQLLAFSRQQVMTPVPLDMNAVIDGLHDLLLPLLGEQIAIALELAADECPIKADLVQLEQVIVNLAINARDAMPDGGPLSISTANVELTADWCARRAGARPGRFVAVTIRDEGCGMSEETKAHVFEPFYTTKPAGQGTGLGLATAYGIVKQMDGYIEIVSAPGDGTTVSVYLPRIAAALAPSSPETQEPRM